MGNASIPEPPGFSEPSKQEQIRYLQALWNRIAEQPGEVPVPDNHFALAEERLASHRREPSKARPAHEALDELAKRSR